MSQTQPIADHFLASEGAKVPAQQGPLVPSAEYGNIRMITPVARASYATLDTPRTVPGSNDPIRRYSVTLLLNPAACTDLYAAICAVANTRWPAEKKPNPQNPNELIDVTGSQLLFWPKEAGGLHYPLRDGNQMYMRDPSKYEAFRGLFTLNASLAEKTRKGVDQRPVFVNENAQPEDPKRFYSGCYVRAQITFGAFPQPGQQIPNRGISVTLNSVQFVSDGPRLTGFDGGAAASSAFAAAGAVGKSGYDPGPGFGPNHATPGSVPPGATAGNPAYGFAAPPSHPGQQAAPGGVPVGAPNPMAQPQAGFGAGGARPPGV